MKQVIGILLFHIIGIHAQNRCFIGLEYNGSCYAVVSSPETWSDAQDVCKTYSGGNLAIIDSQDEFDFVNNIINGSHDYWIGLKKTENVGWITGEVTTFTSWSTNEPDGGKYVRSADILLQWSDATGTGYRPYLCEKDENNGSCPSGWHGFNSSCYVSSTGVTLGNVTTNWVSGKRACFDLGGHLVTISSREENQEVRSLQTIPHWYGMQRGLFYWNGMSMADYTSWISEPGNSLPIDDSCVFADVSNSGKWETAACSSLKGFLCETYAENPNVVTAHCFYEGEKLKDHNLATTEATSIIDCTPQYRCLIGAEYNGSCYHFSSSPETWSDAQDICKSAFGGYLATIDSPDKFEFLNNIMNPPQNYWMGLKKSMELGWVTGESLTFTKWATNEPSGHMYSRPSNGEFSEWIDSSGVGTRPSLCEQAAWGPNDTPNDEPCPAVDPEKAKSISNTINVTLRVTNTLSHPVHFIWLDYNGIESTDITIPAGEQRETSTYATHPWVARSDTEARLEINGSCVYTAEYENNTPVDLYISENNDSCPAGWYIFENSCYVSTETLGLVDKTWVNGKRACVDLGGHLVTISSSEENQEVASLQTGPNWYGMQRGLYYWNNMSMADYTAWDSEPANSLPVDDSCVFANVSKSGKWGTAPCSSPKGFLCETHLINMYDMVASCLDEGERLVNHNLETTWAPSILDCARFCKTNKSCVAFNFEPKLAANNCDLLSETRLNVSLADIIVDASWIYCDVQKH
ncbi:unnamed protein product [Owenia fusiformis]|uniref:Macrophage mannose receptor 1-like n=1 Tax=Owenia fusiformis TaxID=6347 RepID=A0A8S4PMX5_OWEFU|nr:unnamed protein product [Owenia fusiformis]